MLAVQARTMNLLIRMPVVAAAEMLAAGVVRLIHLRVMAAAAHHQIILGHPLGTEVAAAAELGLAALKALAMTVAVTATQLRAV
jgi:hypothetical protein